MEVADGRDLEGRLEEVKVGMRRGSGPAVARPGRCDSVADVGSVEG